MCQCQFTRIVTTAILPLYRGKMPEDIQRLDTLLQRYRAAMTILLGEDEQAFEIRLDTLECCILEVEGDDKKMIERMQEMAHKHFSTAKTKIQEAMRPAESLFLKEADIPHLKQVDDNKLFEF